ncbi:MULTISPECIES: hypothetical protein [Bradyrhizobium]|uniref:hypothetical protein n=1 Tax=Bradyrhizobium TaxID=374 RepID=UPI0015A25AD2|nr:MULTISPECIES: hypothetical protein [Bradyrhizobium]MCA6104382.1 hypothetical protein [Bradyrhizobium australafricanum]MCC8974628.1 hypothetical protein [Bradyrhizobium brasilense]
MAETGSFLMSGKIGNMRAAAAGAGGGRLMKPVACGSRESTASASARLLIGTTLA